MATSSSSSTSILLLHINHHSISNSSSPTPQIGARFPAYYSGGSNFRHLQTYSDRLRTFTKPNPRCSTARINASKDDAVSSLFGSFPSLPDILDIPAAILQNPWVPGIAGFVVAAPWVIKKLLLLSEKVDSAAEVVERIAERVVEAAEEVEKAAEDLEESLPAGGLRRMVSFVEDLAEDTAEGAKKVSHMMDKVDEMTDKLQDHFDDFEPEIDPMPQLPAKVKYVEPGSRRPVAYSTSAAEPSSPECEICRFLKLFDF
ncbi:uncharacterized protein LOC127243489 [Andrographis paniculata]|uniref:uncharacterized protein LOC127243489 n=1 Tax=Andrographis paniculata TaxID=175694 RepID=UPI0021E7CCE5|nr:uncharacterized protein LOC127243489 [Andrographis paniculata]